MDLLGELVSGDLASRDLAAVELFQELRSGQPSKLRGLSL